MNPGLVATTRPADIAAEALLGVGGTPGGLVWRSPELALAGTGTALRVELAGGLTDRAGVRRAEAALGAITVDDTVGRPGTGAVALAALPFDPSAGGSLVVPSTLWGQDRHGAWVTTVGPAGGAPAAATFPPSADGEAPDHFTLVPSQGHDLWRRTVADAVGRIRRGDLEKVVLARRVDVEANRPFPVAEILARLVALYPTCTIFAVDGFIGASPELLLSRRGHDVASHPLAGTVARSGDAAVDDRLVEGLMASEKERWEHRLVVDTLAASLRPHCERLTVPERPSVLALRNVSHLGTVLTGRLRRHGDGGLPGVLRLVAEVHPTPAVAGTPTKDALALLASVEGFDRGRYAGPVGWVSGSGDGDLVLGIRSAQVDGRRASMFAGVGVVADSDPAAELAETQLKLQALLAALVRP